MDQADPKKAKIKYIKLTTHQDVESKRVLPLRWGAKNPEERGPIVATMTSPEDRNAIGTHSGSYKVYRALAIAAGALNPEHRPDLTNTTPAVPIGPFPSWHDPKKIVSIDPYGALISDAFKAQLADGYDVRPTIAVTKAHIHMPELYDAVKAGRLRVDGTILQKKGECLVTKAAVEPVWYLPGMAERFGVKESELRYALFEQTAGMYPELVTRPDLQVFLPPIGGMSIYMFGDTAKLGDEKTDVSCRVHDECNGSDVFGSDICTCRPYLAHGIEVCIEAAQKGGLGIIVYNRKEGRALGEVTKFLVYNARKRQQGGDRAERYFERTECVAGVQDMRFQELMPDILHWLGVERIHRFVSMSNMKYDALIKSGIRIDERLSIPDELIPADAQVEMDAKKAAGYFTQAPPADTELQAPKGRGLED